MQVHHKRMVFLMLVAVLSVVASGCILFTPARLASFKGPSWDVPITLPIVNKSEFSLQEALDTAPDGDGILGLTINLADDISAFEAATSGPVDFSPHAPVEGETTIDLSALTDIPHFQFNTAEFMITITNEPSISGTLELELVGLKNGTEVASEAESAPLVGEPTSVINIASILNARADTLVVRYAFTFDAQAIVVQEGDKLSVAASLRIPLTVGIPAAGISVDLGSGSELNLEGDVRGTLSNAHVSEVEFVVEVESRLPFGFDLVLLFSDTPNPANDPTAIEVRLSAPAGQLGSTGRVVGAKEHVVRLAIDQALLDKLVGEPAYVTPQLTLGGSSGSVQISETDGLAFKAYAIVTFGINKGSKH